MIKKYKQSEITELTKIIKNDGVVSVPTDTVYGLCAVIYSKKAHDKLVYIKNRPLEKAFPIMCANIEQIKSIAIVDENAKKLIKAFMPGPITLILKKNKTLPDFVCNGKDTIAVRMATSKFLEKLIINVENPIFMTSANQSGCPTCKNVEEIEKACPMLDGIVEGKITYGKASTIVDCTLEKIEVLRLGPISVEQINNVLNNI